MEFKSPTLTTIEYEQNGFKLATFGTKSTRTCHPKGFQYESAKSHKDLFRCRYYTSPARIRSTVSHSIQLKRYRIRSVYHPENARYYGQMVIISFILGECTNKSSKRAHGVVVYTSKLQSLHIQVTRVQFLVRVHIIYTFAN